MAEDYSPDKLFAGLLEKIQSCTPNSNIERIRDAFDFAYAAHEGQKRKDGSPYVTHVVAATEIAAEMGLDDDALIACILHDTIEDTDTTYEDLKSRYGKTVADLVEGVTKLTRVPNLSKEDAQAESLRKMFIAMSKDIRVILIKMADRLHNMRTMEFQTPEKQLSKSWETMEIYAPIAHRLGIEMIKDEMEDRALRYLDPIGYGEINNILDRRRDIMVEFQKDIKQQIIDRLEKEGIPVQVYGRLKHIYSIYRKMYAQHLDIEEIFDICAFRVIVSTVADCYNILGIIHEMFRPVPGRFKDYISTPKPNGYQSLHTTVIGKDGIPFEVQIRTWQMHMTAEYGVAAHWKYKAGSSKVDEGEIEQFAWIRHLLESQDDDESSDFIHGIKINMFDDEVFVFTPNGDVKSLPAGATPIDFAYAIHSAVGNHMTGAKVNGRIVPLSYLLQNGDIVTIMTSQSSAGPSRDWLSIARSGEARNKIKQWFKKEKREENISQGRSAFESEWRRAGYTNADLMDEDFLPLVLKKMAVTTIDDMFASIGYGGMSASHAVNRLKDELVRHRNGTNKNELEKMQERADRRTQSPSKPTHGVSVEGLDNCLIKFSRCCSPVPGDDIIGFITRGQGVSIHRKNCPNYLKDFEADPNRWITVGWFQNESYSYEAELHILADNRGALVLDLATMLNSLNAKVLTLNAKDLGNGHASAVINLEVKNLEELRNISSKLKNIHSVRRVFRPGEEE